MSEQVLDLPRPSSRKVWVVNQHTETYSEEFRGRRIDIPANSRKEVLMPLLEAERFLGQPKAPGRQRPDGSWETPPKALKIVELTEDEIKKIEGKTSVDLKKELKEEEKSAKHSCAICGGEMKTPAALKRHITMNHPEFEPVKEE